MMRTSRTPASPTTRARRVGVAAALVGSALLAGCASSDPLADPSSNASGDASTAAGEETVVVGSQDYYSNEIIAELYAQALEADGITVDRQMRIGQREVYMPELESGEIDLFPEYTGPVLQYWTDEEPAEHGSDAVYEALTTAAPDGLQVLDQAPATDQDSYTVTREFSEANGVTSIEDLANVDEPLTMGANSEGENRPNGPKGLAEVYGVDVAFTPIEDGGGPLTVRALEDDSIQLAIMYTADPSVLTNDLVTLEDPKGLFLASNVVPLASDGLSEEAVTAVNEVSAKLTSDALLELNQRSVEEQLPAGDIAGEWLAEQGLV